MMSFDQSFVKSRFPDLASTLKRINTPEYAALPEDKKSARLSELLLKFINAAGEPAFLFSEVIDFLETVQKEGILSNFTFAHFELWLNHYSGLTFEENRKVRAKISGRYIPREVFQLFFPVGMGKVYDGPHFVTAHGSPDLDTTIASFWGWMDAFSARVADGLHLWNLPGGPPESQVEIPFLFHRLFGNEVFSLASLDRSALALSSLELMSGSGVVKKLPEESTFSADGEQDHRAVIVVDTEGYYLGEWRTLDVEGVRQIVMLLSSCLRWFESYLHLQLISVFVQKKVTIENVAAFATTFLRMKIEEMEPVKEFSPKQKRHLQDCLLRVLNLPQGLKSTIESLGKSLQERGISAFVDFFELFSHLEVEGLFDKSGLLIEERTEIFVWFEKIVEGLKDAIKRVRTYLEQFDIALSIKRDVFGILPHTISFRAELEEIRSKMGASPYLTVTSVDKEGKLVPLGVVYATDLYKPILGTVTLRDFSNREETKIPPYLTVISFVDHHKMSLTTESPVVGHLSDAQSANTATAQLSFRLNDQFSTSGMTAQEIKEQVAELKKDLSTPSQKRSLARLLYKEIALQRKDYYVDSKREYTEYLHYLFAILDDTDLLTKVSPIDVETVASLMNRLTTLKLKKESEIISFDDIATDKEFAAKAAAKLLKLDEMYAFYNKIYQLKEESVEENLKSCAMVLFSDTKVQNGCARVGQIKIFPRNYPTFAKVRSQIRKTWLEEAKNFNKENREVDLHLQMASTIAGAEDLYHGKKSEYPHRDELWIWVTDQQSGIEHLKNFLNAFSSAPFIEKAEVEVQFLGDNAKELEAIFTESFPPVPRKIISDEKERLPIAVLTYKAGAINSRKAMISPYLPHLV